jgi:sRNA-binding carbon storage regulator CsrA
MLALSRRIGEELVFEKDGQVIGTIHVSNISDGGGKVSLAFDFPREIGIHRRERFDQLFHPSAKGQTHGA